MISREHHRAPAFPGEGMDCRERPSLGARWGELDCARHFEAAIAKEFGFEVRLILMAGTWRSVRIITTASTSASASAPG